MLPSIEKCPLCGKGLIRVYDTNSTLWFKCDACEISTIATSFKDICKKIKTGTEALAVVPKGQQITMFNGPKTNLLCIYGFIEPIPLTAESVLEACKKGLEAARDTYEYSPDPQLLIDIDTVLNGGK